MPGISSSKRPKLWINPKFKKREYVGVYERKRGERQLRLIENVRRKGCKRHSVVFESHENAKRLGWRAV